jgi:hypothetical protein
MTMEEVTPAPPAEAEDGQRARLQPHTRIDWRTGRPMLVRGAAFWKEHDARRIEQGLSVSAYCQANGLAMSTFRRYVTRDNASSQGAAARAQATVPPSRFVPVHGTAVTAGAMAVEIETGDGMKLRLSGAAADQLLQHVLGRLA